MRLLANIVVNILIFVVELALIVAITALGRYYPAWFAAATGIAAFALGLVLERARLAHELPFYFERGLSVRLVWVEIVAIFTAAFKGLIAALVALLTFSGTQIDRLNIIALVFIACVFAGSAILRRFNISFGARGPRWGFFRLGVPLGLLYAQILALLVLLGALAKPDALGTLKDFIFNLPERPGLAQAGEFLFSIEQVYDDLVGRFAGLLLPADWAPFVSALISVKLLSGFVIAIYAVLVSEVVRVMEEAAARGRAA